MVSRSYLPLLVKTEKRGPAAVLDVNAKRSENERKLILQVVNSSERPVSSALQLSGYAPRRKWAQIEELAAPLQAVNTAAAPDRIKPNAYFWEHSKDGKAAEFSFKPHSFTLIRFE